MGIESPTDWNIIIISVLSVGFVFQIAVGVVACRGMLQRKIESKLSGLFVLSWITACTYSISFITTNALEMKGDGFGVYIIYRLIGIPTVMLFFIFLLLTLVLRLRLTFKDSIYRMSQRTYYMFIGIICLLFSITCIISFPFVFGISLHLEEMTFALMAFFFIFFIGSALAVYFFVSNLSKLAKSMRNSMRNTNISAEEISLNKSQQKLVDLAARYLLLFGIATFSSLISCYCGIYAPWTRGGTSEIANAIDFGINIFCLYLQFGFAKNVYLRCCWPLDKLCRRAMSKRTRHSIHELAIASVVNDPGAESPSSDSGKDMRNAQKP